MSRVDSSTVLARIRYSEGQAVSLSSLQAEQQYLIGARRRHNLAQHDWGIVRGLALRDNFGSILVDPGVAIDGFGRELIVPAEVLIAPGYLVQLDADSIAAFLVYSLADQPACNGPRTAEQALVRLMSGTAADFDPRQPPCAPVNRAPSPVAVPPDDPAVEWPVFLGMILRDAPGATTFHVDTEPPDVRPYAGLRGENIASPSGFTEVQVGAEKAGDNRAFAVSTRDAAGKGPNERFSLDIDGNSAAHGSVSVLPAGDTGGNVTIERAAPPVTSTLRTGLGGCDQTGASMEPRYWGIQFGTVPIPKVATPWQVYRVVNPPPESNPAEGPSNELRFEVLDPGKTGSRAADRFAIGVAGAKGYEECFAVDASCTVSIGGELTVKGSLVLGPLQPDPSNPLLQAILVSGWIQGLLGNTGQVSHYYGAALTVFVALPDQGFVNEPVDCTVTVSNTGNARIDRIQLAETHTLSGVTATLPDRFDLGAGSSVDKTITFKATVPGTLGIKITAAGASSVGSYVVNASGDGSVEIVQRAKIQAAIDAPATGTANAPVSYTVTITDNGPVALSHVNATEQVTADSGPLATDLMLDQTLQVGQARQFSRNATRATAGKLKLQINASGSGPGSGNSAAGSDTKTVDIMAFQVSVVPSANPGEVTIKIVNAGAEDLTIESITPTVPAGVNLGGFANPGAIAAGQSKQSVSTVTLGSGIATFTAALDIKAKRPSGDIVTQISSITV